MVTKRLSLKHADMLNKHRYILEKLAASNMKNRKIILKNSPPELFKVLGIVFNLLANKKLDLDNKQHQTLKKHRRLIRSMIGLKGAGMKQKLVAQRGGALATILSTVLPILGGILQSIF